ALWTLGIIKAAEGPRAALPSLVQTFGTTLFGKMNLFIFAAIWIFVPLATADAVSRERREGTLALLYLTKLGPFGIVVGKAFVHMLRSLTLFVTMVPWLILPLVFGGVELRDLAMALMLDLAALLLAQAAGLLASTIPRDWLKSVILAECFGLILLLAMLNEHGRILGNVVRRGMPGTVTRATPAFWNSPAALLCDVGDYWSSQPGLISRTARLIELTTNPHLGRPDYWGWGGYRYQAQWRTIWTALTPSGPALWFRSVGEMLLAALLVLGAAMAFGAWRVQQSWHDAPVD